MRRETKAERAAWTAHIEGTPAAKPSKYNNERSEHYDSRYEAGVATNLAALAACGKIRNLREQVPLVLVEGKGKIRPIIWRADFTYNDLEGKMHWLDAKGFKKNPVYLLKKKLAKLLHSIEIEEV